METNGIMIPLIIGSLLGWFLPDVFVSYVEQKSNVVCVCKKSGESK